MTTRIRLASKLSDIIWYLIIQYLNSDSQLTLYLVNIASNKNIAADKFKKLILQNQSFMRISTIETFASYGYIYYHLARDAHYIIDGVQYYPYRQSDGFLKWVVKMEDLCFLQMYQYDEKSCQQILIYAVEFGKLSILKWVLDTEWKCTLQLGNTYCHSTDCRLQQKLVQLLLDNGFKLTKEIVKGVLITGDVELFTEILYKMQLPSSEDIHFLLTEVHNCKVHNCKVHSFQILHKYHNIYFGPISKEIAKDIAKTMAKSGNLESLVWWYTLYPDVFDNTIFGYGVIGGFPVLEWMSDLPTIQHPSTSIEGKCGNVTNAAKFELFRFMMYADSEFYKKCDIFEILEFLLEHGHIFDNFTLYSIAEHASVELFIWLSEKLLTFCTNQDHIFLFNVYYPEVYMSAIKGGNLALADWVIDNHSEELQEHQYSLVSDDINNSFDSLKHLSLDYKVKRIRLDPQCIVEQFDQGYVSNGLDGNYSLIIFNDYDNIDIDIKYEHAPLSCNIVSVAVANNCLSIVRLLIENGCKFSINQCIFCAIRFGNLQMLMYFKKHTSSKTMGNVAEYNGNDGNDENDEYDEYDEYDDTKYLYTCWNNPNLCNIAAYYGHLSILKWLIKNKCRLNIDVCIQNAIKAPGSRLPIIKFLKQLLPIKLSD